MNSRRIFLGQLGLAGAAWAAERGAADNSAAAAQPFADDRSEWLQILRKVAEPVLENLAKNRLKELMPVESAPGQQASRKKVTHLEAVGRTLAGIAPWLELAGKSVLEVEPAERWLGFTQEGLTNCADPKAADYIDFSAGAQCLVDAAFLCHAFLRAPRVLWGKCEPQLQDKLVRSLRKTRQFKPGNNNWLLFSAMIEVFFASIGAEWEEEPVAKAIASHQEWYKGDGLYGDGPDFHWDYYNSFVIQPFLIDILQTIRKASSRWNDFLDPTLRRAQRYAAIQERLIAPDGSYPAIGRSIAYRCGAFQLLAQMALRRQLPPELTPGQVRSALSAVIRRTLNAPGTFDDNGWLRIGLAGRQPSLGEGYISTGSLYLCTFAFLPLGLPANDPFWMERGGSWTSRKIWSGENLPADHALPHGV